MKKLILFLISSIFAGLLLLFKFGVVEPAYTLKPGNPPTYGEMFGPVDCLKNWVYGALIFAWVITLFIANRKKTSQMEKNMNITIVPYKKMQINDFPELCFGMPVKQFDKYFPNSEKFTKWDCQCRYAKLLIKGEYLVVFASFSEGGLLEDFELDFRNFCDENINFTVNEKNVTGYSQLLGLLCRNDDVRENDCYDTLGFPKHGIYLKGFHGEPYSLTLEMFTLDYGAYEAIEDRDDFHSYPKEMRELKKYKNEFIVMPDGVFNEDLGKIELGDTREALDKRLLPYCREYDLNQKQEWSRIDYAFAVEYDSEGSDSDRCEAIYLGFADRTVEFCGVKLGQEDDWQKKLLLAKPDAVHLPKKHVFLIPDDRIFITESPKRIYWLPQSRYDIWASDYQKAEARLK